MALSNLTLSERSLRISLVGPLYEINIFASSNITTLIWMSGKGVCWWAGFSAVSAVFLHVLINKKFTFSSCLLTWDSWDPIGVTNF